MVLHIIEYTLVGFVEKNMAVTHIKQTDRDRPGVQKMCRYTSG